MRVIERQSGRKLGSYKDARIAHAIHHDRIAGRVQAMRDYRKAYDVWQELYWAGKADHSTCPKRPPYRCGLPEGWERIGSGCYRTAYLSPKGVVYKVNQEGYDSKDDGGNYHEVHNIIKLRSTGSVPPGWAVPDATLYKVGNNDYVVAMPLIDTSAPMSNCAKGWNGGRCTCVKDTEGYKRMGERCSHEVVNAVKYSHAGLGDLHSGNVFPDEKGVMWVVDVGI